MPDNLGGPARTIKADDREPAGHRVRQRVRESLKPRREDKQIRGLESRERVGAGTHKDNSLRQIQDAAHGLKIILQRPAPQTQRPPSRKKDTDPERRSMK